ncbi:MAG: EAL domain-containing protein [Gammaproteobacteria bacterium]|nr:EAL domain-containing protein [Gammaproteobacteria bacterium]
MPQKPITKRPINLRHLLLIVTVTVLFSVAAALLIIKKYDDDIAFVAQEITALDQINSLFIDIPRIQDCRSYRQRRLAGLAVPTGWCTQMHQTLRGRFGDKIRVLTPKLADQLRYVRDNLDALFIEADDLDQPLRQFAAYNHQIEVLIKLIRDIADHGNLTFDSTVDSHYLARVLVHSLPDISESIATLRGLLTYAFTGAPQMARVAPLIRQQIERFHLHIIDYDRSIYVLSQQADPVTVNIVRQFDLWLTHTNSYLERVTTTLDNQTIDSEIDNSLFLDATAVLDEFDSNRQIINSRLNSLLDERKKDLLHDRNLVILLTLFAVIFLQALFYWFYRHIRRIFNSLENTQQRLVLSESRHQSTFHAVVDGIVIINEYGIIVDANPATSKLFGFPLKEIVGRNVSILMPSPYKEEHDGYLAHYRNGQSARIIGIGREVTGQRKDGSIFPMVLSVSEFHSEGQRYFTGLVHDITAQKAAVDEILNAHHQLETRVEERTTELSQANQELHELIIERNRSVDQLRLFAKVFENAGEAIIITDANQRILNANATFSKITGYSRAEALGLHPKNFSSGRHDALFYQKMWQQINSQGFWQGEVWDKRKNGEIYPKRLSINVVNDEKGKVTHYVGIFSDITILKSTEEQLQNLAYCDPLTELNNRTMFHILLNNTYESARREKSRFALLFIDLDRFKMVNDTLGHTMGDQLLVIIAKRLRQCLRKSDTISRIGGDEFTAILPNIHRTDQVADVALKIINEVSQPVLLNDNEVNVGSSIGISIFPDDGEDIETLTKHADIAMYKVKESGRNSFRFFDASMNDESVQRMRMERKLRYALENNQFSLFYQAKVDANSNIITGAEALLRWIDEEDGFIPPDRFIPVAEDSGLILPLGEWVIRDACRQLQLWNNSGLHTPPLQIAVNLSPLQFQQPSLCETVAAIMQEYETAKGTLCIEVTESMILYDINKVIAILNDFRNMGVQISLDDFGTGYSSLAHLKRLPLDHIKIDRSFVRDIESDSDDAAIVAAIISMSHRLGLKVIAEGVESKEQLNYLRELHCDQIQGYYISRPLPAHQFAEFVYNAEHPPSE